MNKQKRNRAARDLHVISRKPIRTYPNEALSWEIQKTHENPHTGAIRYNSEYDYKKKCYHRFATERDAQEFIDKNLT